MNILMTGSTGFLGINLFREFSRDDHKITILIRSTSDVSQLKSLSNNLRIVYLTNDFLNKELELDLMLGNQYDLIVHAATDYYRNENLSSPLFTNVVLPVFLLKFAIKNKILKFINFDTFFNDKKKSYNHLQEYTLTKTFFYEYANLLCVKYKDITFLNLKIFHMYGPGDKEDKFIPNIISRCASGKKIDLTNGLQKRDFIHIDDVVSATKIVANKTFLPGFYNFDVGTGISTSIKDLVVLVNKLLGNRSILNFGALPNRYNEPLDSRANILPLNKLGWSFTLGLEEGIKDLTSRY